MTLLAYTLHNYKYHLGRQPNVSTGRLPAFTAHSGQYVLSLAASGSSAYHRVTGTFWYISFWFGLAFITRTKQGK